MTLLGLALSSCIAQSNLIRDNDGYALQIDEYNHEIKAGQSEEIALNVLRSRLYVQKPTKLKVLSPLPEDLTFTISPNPITEDKTTIQIGSTVNTRPGIYTIVVSGDSVIPGMPSKGIILKLSIN